MIHTVLSSVFAVGCAVGAIISAAIGSPYLAAFSGFVSGLHVGFLADGFLHCWASKKRAAMTGARILADWLGPDCAAYRLSSGKVVQIPLADADWLARDLFRLSIESRSAGELVERPQPAATGAGG